MHPYMYLNLREPQAQDFFLVGSRSLKAPSVGTATQKGMFRIVEQAVERTVRDQRVYMSCEPRDSDGCCRIGLLQSMRIETR
jgi:hypothetical protein